MRPGESEDDYPWAAFYKRALSAGIGDAAFWRMSPAAVLLVTSGREKRIPWAKRPGQAKKKEPMTRIGDAADCP